MAQENKDSLKGQVALITGAGSGMGQLAAQDLSRRGAVVAALDIDEKGLGKTCENHEDIHSWTVDITDFQGLKTVVETLESKLGPVDRIYNSAGIMPLGKLLDQDVAVIHRLMDVSHRPPPKVVA